MRTFGYILAIWLLPLCPLTASAQDKPKEKPKLPPLRILERSIHVGFQGYELGRFYYKAGMWAPVQASVTVGDEPIKGAKMYLETSDSERAPTVTTIPIHQQLNAEETRTFRSYLLPGNMASEVKVRVKTPERVFEKEFMSQLDRLESSTQLFLTLGCKIPDLQRALVMMRTDNNRKNDAAQIVDPNANPNPVPDDGDENDTKPRFAAFETDAKTLPDRWYGYQAVDLLILTTENKEFLKGLLDRDELARRKALATWVRRGGHLIVSVHWNNQDLVSELFSDDKAWQPPLPVKIPSTYDDKRFPQKIRIRDPWGDNHPFGDPTGKDKFPLAQLQARGSGPQDWDVLIETDKEGKEGKGESMPIMTRLHYGLGSITFLAFSVDPKNHSPFTQWEGRTKFWRKIIESTIPKLPLTGNFGGRWQGDGTNDVISRLHDKLDIWDVKIVPFGWVAVFILLYIVIVGPVDYLVLKYVFKRLEWTWVTFPIVVCGVSFAAYFTAYAIKGKELRVNQIDIVDIDMRTEVDDKMRPTKAYIYGNTYFSLLSPTIHDYTIGLEPNPRFWGQETKTPQSADMMAWLGKGGTGWSGMGGRTEQGMWGRPYYFGDPEGPGPLQEPAVGLCGVRITVWTSKAFSATWEAALPDLPLQAELAPTQQEDVMSVKLVNNMPVDLEDVWLFYQDEARPLTDVLPGNKAKEFSMEVMMKEKNRRPADWVVMPDSCDDHRVRAVAGRDYNPTQLVKQLFVFNKSTPNNTGELNQWLKPLDMSWRLSQDRRPYGNSEAILYARVRFRAGLGETIYSDNSQPAPTRIWLGELPPGKGRRPTLSGNLNQDTYIRVFVPVRPRQ